MPDPFLARPPRGRLIAGAALALLVQAGWVVMLRLEHRAPATDAPAAGLQVRLLQPAVSPPSPEQVTPPTPTATPLPGVKDVKPLEYDWPLAGSEFPSSSNTVAGPAPAAPTRDPSERRSSTLNLALPPPRVASGPRDSMAEMAVRDPRANSERHGVEWAVQDGAGTLPVVVQAGTSGSGTTLIRQGSKCTRVIENRVAALHPMDERLRGAPSLSGSCFTR